MAAQFEIFKDKAGEFRFRLRAANGEIILASEGYTAKASAKNGIASVQRNATSADSFEAKTNRGKFSFTLHAGNRQVIGVSQSYTTERACKGGIAAVTKAAPKAKIQDLTV